MQRIGCGTSLSLAIYDANHIRPTGCNQWLMLALTQLQQGLGASSHSGVISEPSCGGYPHDIGVTVNQSGGDSQTLRNIFYQIEMDNHVCQVRNLVVSWFGPTYILHGGGIVHHMFLGSMLADRWGPLVAWIVWTAPKTRSNASSRPAGSWFMIAYESMTWKSWP